MSSATRFKVTDHFQIAERGAFVIGHIVEGTIRLGMVAFARDGSARFTVRAVEYLDNLAEKKFWNALLFSEHADLETVRNTFPVGSIIEVRDEAR